MIQISVRKSADVWLSHFSVVIKVRGIRTDDRRKTRVPRFLHTIILCADYFLCTPLVNSSQRVDDPFLQFVGVLVLWCRLSTSCCPKQLGVASGCVRLTAYWCIRCPHAPHMERDSISSAVLSVVVAFMVGSNCPQVRWNRSSGGFGFCFFLRVFSESRPATAAPYVCIDV